MDMYREHILDHYHNPRGWGELPGAHIAHEVFNEMCGDRLVVQLIITEDKVQDVRFNGQGCAISVAGASLLYGSVVGKSKQVLLDMDLADMQRLLAIEISPRRMNCALLALTTLQGALVST